MTAHTWNLTEQMCLVSYLVSIRIVINVT